MHDILDWSLLRVDISLPCAAALCEHDPSGRRSAISFILYDRSRAMIYSYLKQVILINLVLSDEKPQGSKMVNRNQNFEVTECFLFKELQLSIAHSIICIIIYTEY